MPNAAAQIDVILRGKNLSGVATNVARRFSRRKHGVRVVRKYSQVPGASTRDVYVVGYVRDLLEDSEARYATDLRTSGKKRFLIFQGGSGANEIAQMIVRLNIRSADRVYVVHRSDTSPEEFVNRFVSALSGTEDDESIADARWDGDTLVVVSPTYRSLLVPLEKLMEIRRAPEAQWRSFEIDPHGRFLYWPGLDVHMAWPQFLQAVDSKARLRAEQKSKDFNRAYGAAIRSLREATGLTQSDVEGLDARTVRRIETGGTRATSKALEKLADAHGMSLNDYMNELAKRL